MTRPLAPRTSDRIVTGLIVGVTPESGDGHPPVRDHLAHLFISGPGSLEQTSTGPIQVRVSVPRGYTHELVARDDGFGRGYDVRIDQVGGEGAPCSELRMEVLVPSEETVPIELEMIPDAVDPRDLPCRHGRSNRPTEIVTSTLTWPATGLPELTARR
jgi:hypothetical protein